MNDTKKKPVSQQKVAKTGKVSGRRGAAVHHGVLVAALEEFVESGYTALTIEKVAARAGVHKTTIYRRWPDRDALLTDALLEFGMDEFDIPDTGDIEADLGTALRIRAAWMTGRYGRRLVSVMQSDAMRLPGIQENMQRVIVSRSNNVLPRVASAIKKGQLPENTDPILLLTTLLAPLYLSLLVTRLPVTDEDCHRAASITVLAAQSGLLQASS